MKLPLRVTGNHAIDIDLDDSAYEDYHIISENRCLCEMQSKENAEFIVKACNNHEKLKEALRELVEVADYVAAESLFDPIDKARAVLKEVE
jgi:hypothetical protein